MGSWEWDKPRCKNEESLTESSSGRGGTLTITTGGEKGCFAADLNCWRDFDCCTELDILSNRVVNLKRESKMSM